MVQDRCLVADPHDPYFVALKLLNPASESCRAEFWDPTLNFGQGLDF
jgi:hypothetical protein